MPQSALQVSATVAMKRPLRHIGDHVPAMRRGLGEVGEEVNAAKSSHLTALRFCRVATSALWLGSGLLIGEGGERLRTSIAP